MKILEIDKFNFSYDTKKILNNISISINKAESIGLVGANGAGKTTLIKSIENFEALGSSISIKDIKHNYPRIIHDTPHVYPYLTGSDYIYYLLSLKNLYTPKNIEKSNLYVKNFGLSEDLDSLIKGYSFGMKRKIYMIPLLIENNNLLLLDEPTNGLDTQSVIFLKEIIAQRKIEDKTTFIASHNMNFLEDTCEKTYLLNQNQITDEYLPNRNISLEEFYKSRLLIK